MKKNKSKRLVLIVTVVAVILVGGWFWYSAAGPTMRMGQGGGDIYALRSDDITKGNSQAKAVLIEYGDFQCGACQYMHEQFRLVWRVVKDDLYLVYRHFPLSQHAHSRMASRYSEAMNRQEKFWPFHDLLYDHQSDWSSLSISEAESFFQSLVIEVGGDLEQVKEDLKDPSIEDKINQDLDLGMRSEVLGTPTLILNGNKISIPNDLSKFVSDIKALNQP